MKRFLRILSLFVLCSVLLFCVGCGGGDTGAGEGDGGGGGGNGYVGIIVSPGPDEEYPSTTIRTPSDKSSYVEGDLIAFEGSGVDAEGVSLDGRALVWTSSIDGPIGEGESVIVNNLSPGLHLVTLSVGDTRSEDDQVRIAVWPVELYHDTVIATCSVGSYPNSIAVSADSEYIYITEYGDDSVSVIRLSDHTVVGTVPVGNRPTELAITPNGEQIYVINSLDRSLSVIETAGNTVVDTITISSRPSDVCVSPDGDFVHIATGSVPGLLKYRTLDNSFVRSVVPIRVEPDFIRLSPDGSRIYAASHSDDRILVVDSRDYTITDEIVLPKGYPNDMALTADGYLHVARSDYKISVYQTPDHAPVDTTSLTFKPKAMNVPGSPYTYLSNHRNSLVYVLHRQSKTIIDTIFADDHIRDLKISPDGKYGFVLSGGADGTFSVLAKSEW